MSVRVVDEGIAFEIAGEDRIHLSRALRGSLQWREAGVVIWGVVGHMRLPSGTTLVVRSKKAPAACLLAWASYVDPTLGDLKSLRPLDDVGADGDVGAALAALFVRELLAVAGAHGVRRRYHRVATRTATLRGSIDFAALSRNGGDLSRTPCVVWERLPRTPLNQFLAQALRLIRRDPVMRRVAGAGAAELEAAFLDVPPAIDPDLLEGRRPLDRDELPFAVACALARLLLRDGGLGTGTSDKGLGFLVRLDSLFERTVVKALRDAGLPAIAKLPARYQRLDESGVGREAYRELDCFVELPSGPLVIDAKYKSDVSWSNVDQMVSYCLLTGARRALLVFPAGQLEDRRAFVLASQAGHGVQVALLQFDVDGRDVADWRSAARRFASDVEQLAGKSAELGRSLPANTKQTLLNQS